MEDTEMYKEMMDRMPGGFFVYHADGEEELISVNQSVLRIFGCDTLEEFKELTGYTFKGLVHPDDIDRIEKSIQNQIKDSEYALDYIEYRIVRKDGTVRWVEDYGHFMHTERYGDVYYVFIEDATERMSERTRRLEEMNRKLRRAYSMERQYKNAILNDAISFFEVNVTRNLLSGSVIQVVNGKQMDLFDYLGIQPVKKYTELLQFVRKNRRMPDDEDYFRFLNPNRLIRCYEKGDCEQVYETWVVGQVGRKRLIRYIFLLDCEDETGDVIGLFIARDLTNMAEGRTLLNLAFDQMRAAQTARDVFLSNMSHDLRTPLNGIIGYAKIIREVQGDRERCNQYLDKIELLSEQLVNTIDGSLEYSKLESGRSILQEEKGDIVSLAAEVKKMVMPMVRSKNMDFCVDTSEVVHPLIMMDDIHLRRALYEILDNAVKYTEPGGSIRFIVREKKGAPKGFIKYQFVISDNGSGITEELMERIYEPFERGHDMMEGGVIGSGFGLSVVKGLVGMMEGSIDIESRRGEGSRFIVTILFKLAE